VGHFVFAPARLMAGRLLPAPPKRKTVGDRDEHQLAIF
jgi:hypothetical protein